MRKTLLVACSTLLLTLTLGPVTAASARSDAFRGTWTAIDVLDTNSLRAWGNPIPPGSPVASWCSRRSS